MARRIVSKEALAVIIIFFSCTTLEWIFICPWYIQYHPLETWLPIVIVLSLTTLATGVNFSYASFMNPGFLPKAAVQSGSTYRKLQRQDVIVNGVTVRLRFCRHCNFYRLPRMAHCTQCGYCVDNFDHHCEWINNCVGQRNYRFFFVFICSVVAHILVSIAICLNSLFKHHSSDSPLSYLNVTQSVVAVVVIGCGILIAMPVLLILYFHLFLMFKGLTSYEFFTKKYAENWGRSPFDMGPCRNCAFHLCGPEYPVFKHVEISPEEEPLLVQRELLAKFAEEMKKRDNEKDKQGDDDELQNVRVDQVGDRYKRGNYHFGDGDR